VNAERYCAAPLSWLGQDGRLLAISRVHPRWAVVNETAAQIIRFCESGEGRTFSDIRNTFQARYGPVEPTDFAGWLDRLIDTGLLVRSTETPAPTPSPSFEAYRVEHVYVELLARCNLRCAHCFMGGAPEREESLDPDEVFALLQEFAACGGQYVTLSGGEPLLYRQFAAVARSVKQRGLYGTVISNGTLLRAADLALLDELGFNLAISLDGITPEVNARIRGRSSAKPIEAIERALDRLGPDRFILSFTPVKANLTELPRLFEFVETKGIRRLNLSLYEAVGRAVDHPHLLTMDAADRLTVMRAVYRQAVRWAGRTEIDFNDTRDILTQFSPERTSAELHPLWRGVRVTSTGDVYPSSFGAVERFRLGNIRETPFATLLGSATLRDLYHALIDRDGKTVKCRDCTWRQICRGGSVASAYCAHSDIYSPDAYCDAYLDVFPEVVVALSELVPRRPS